MKLSVSLYSGDLIKITDTHMLINSRATGNFINYDSIARNHSPKEQLLSPLYANNANGSPNKNGMIRFHTQLTL